jgi:mannose-6-phosphate isomerase-like protein (cupin superfamily)
MPVVESIRREAMMVERGQGQPVHVIGEDVTIKISSRDTGGAFTVFEGHTQPDEGPPLHRHRDQDEWWHILKGEFRFEVDGREIYAGVGDTVLAPGGSAHTFQNIGTKPGHMVTTVVPGGLDLFFEELEMVAPRGTVPDHSKLIPILEKHGQQLLGPPLGVRPATVASGAD